MATIKGSKGGDALIGTDADDTIRGGKGADVIDGRGGTDALVGGKGKDTFLFRVDQPDVDTILDFQSGVDRIVVEAPDGVTVVYQDYALHPATFGEGFPPPLTIGAPFAILFTGPATLSSPTDLFIL